MRCNNLGPVCFASTQSLDSTVESVAAVAALAANNAVVATAKFIAGRTGHVKCGANAALEAIRSKGALS